MEEQENDYEVEEHENTTNLKKDDDNCQCGGKKENLINWIF